MVGAIVTYHEERSHTETIGSPRIEHGAPKIVCRDVNVHYGEKLAIANVSVDIAEKEVTAFIGPSGCGKSTFLRCINRMNDTIRGCSVRGVVQIDETDVYSDKIDPVLLRARVGMVFQKPNPFPKTIYENVAYGPRIHGLGTKRQELDEIVEASLIRAGLWGEVKDMLRQPGTSLSGGQQQRLCIARVLAVEPEVILMDEPCSALDPIATLKIEDLMRTLAKDYSIIIVTHNMQQAARVSDMAAFFMMEEDRAGVLVEYGSTSQIFTNPRDKRTEDYITGRFG